MRDRGRRSKAGKRLCFHKNQLQGGLTIHFCLQTFTVDRATVYCSVVMLEKLEFSHEVLWRIFVACVYSGFTTQFSHCKRIGV